MSTKVMMGVAIALAAVLASPAFAQSAAQRNGAYGAYARQILPYVRETRRHSANPAWDVYDDAGRYVGTDPDPTIRSTLARDPNEGRGN